MNKWIKEKLSIIIIIFLLLNPFFDLATGLSLNLLNTNITVGMVARMLFLIFILYTAIIVYKKKRVLLYLGILFVYLSLFMFSVLTSGHNLFLEASALFRVFYFPLVLLSLFELKEEFKVSKMTLVSVFAIYLILLFVPKLIEVGFASYEITKVGTIGFFYSANEIGGILSILLPLLFIGIYKKKYLYFYLSLLIIFLITVAYIGTKTPLLAFILVLFMVCLWYLILWIKRKQYIKIAVTFISLILFILIGIQIIPNTNFYKNIRTHLDFLEVEHISEIVRDKALIDHFVFGQRFSFLENRHEQYMASPVNKQLIGLGYEYDGEKVKMIEMDYFDIFYSQGVIGFILFFLAYGYVLVNVIKEKQKLNFKRYMLFASLFLILGLSLFTGHIIVAPSVSFIVALLILQLAKQKKRLLFTAYDLRNIEKETSLIELLNYIDYDKYEMTLILEQKEGELLNCINKDIQIKEYKESKCPIKMIRKVINRFNYLKFILLNADEYDFSCTYATYRELGAKLTLAASKNNVLYIYSDYSKLYNKEEYKDFFNTKNIEKYKNFIFVSNKSRNHFNQLYKGVKVKTVDGFHMIPGTPWNTCESGNR